MDKRWCSNIPGKGLEVPSWKCVLLANQDFSEAATVTFGYFPISHLFPCNCRLTLHHVALTLCSRSIGRALFGVHFRPLQEIGAIMEAGQIFDTGSIFTRLRYHNSFFAV